MSVFYLKTASICFVLTVLTNDLLKFKSGLLAGLILTLILWSVRIEVQSIVAESYSPSSANVLLTEVILLDGYLFVYSNHHNP